MYLSKIWYQKSTILILKIIALYNKKWKRSIVHFHSFIVTNVCLVRLQPVGAHTQFRVDGNGQGHGIAHAVEYEGLHDFHL